MCECLPCGCCWWNCCADCTLGISLMACCFSCWMCKGDQIKSFNDNCCNCCACVGIGNTCCCTGLVCCAEEWIRMYYKKKKSTKTSYQP